MKRDDLNPIWMEDLLKISVKMSLDEYIASHSNTGEDTGFGDLVLIKLNHQLTSQLLDHDLEARGYEH